MLTDVYNEYIILITFSAVGMMTVVEKTMEVLHPEGRRS